jgi:hypothetical protein
MMSLWFRTPQSVKITVVGSRTRRGTQFAILKLASENVMARK